MKYLITGFAGNPLLYDTYDQAHERAKRAASEQPRTKFRVYKLLETVEGEEQPVQVTTSLEPDA
jgi:hypothetical protein